MSDIESMYVGCVPRPLHRGAGCRYVPRPCLERYLNYIHSHIHIYTYYDNDNNIFVFCSFIALLSVIFAVLLPFCLFLVPRKFLCSPQHQNVWYCPQFSASSCHLQIVEWAPRLAPRVNDTDVPKSLSYRPSVAVLSPLEPHLPLTISPRSTAQVYCRLQVAGVSPESVVPVHHWLVVCPALAMTPHPIQNLSPSLSLHWYISKDPCGGEQFVSFLLFSYL